ncbi:EpsG family protein [Moellerella wisconsensis]
MYNGDTLEYYHRFQSTIDYYPTEVLFGAYTKLISFFTLDPNIYVTVLILTCILLQLVSIIIACGREKISLLIVLFISNSFILLTWSGIYRNGLSIPFLILSFTFLYQKKLFTSFFLLLVSILIHNSSIIFLPVWFIILFNRTISRFDKLIFNFCLFILSISMFLDVHLIRESISFIITNFIQPVIPNEYLRLTRYFTSNVTEFNNENSSYLIATSKIQLEAYIQIIIFSFLFIRDRLNIPQNNFWGKIYIYSIVLYSLSIGIAFSYRFYLVSSFIFCIYIYFRVFNFNIKNRIIFSILLLFMYLLFCFYSLPPEKIGLMYLNPF